MAKTVEDLQKLLDYVGIEADTEDDFKKAFDEKFMSKEAHKKEVGQRFTNIDSAFLETYKLIDPTISSRKMAAVRFEENLNSFKEKLSGVLKEKDEAAKSGNDKKVNDLTKLLEDKEKSLAAYMEANENLKTEFDAFKTESQSQFKNYKLSDRYNKVKSQIAFVDNADRFKMRGYEDTLREDYIFDLDENDELIVKGKDGKPVVNKAKAGHFLSPKEVMELMAEEAELLKKNNAKPVVVYPSKTERPSVNGTRQLPPDYLKKRKELGV